MYMAFANSIITNGNLSEKATNSFVDKKQTRKNHAYNIN